MNGIDPLLTTFVSYCVVGGGGAAVMVVVRGGAAEEGRRVKVAV